MASSKKNYKSRAKTLRTLGLLPQGYKLNALTDSQKRHIRRLEKKYPNQVAHPSRYFSLNLPISQAKNIPSFYTKGRRGNKSIVLFTQKHHARNAYYRKSDGALVRVYGNRRVVSYPFETKADAYKRIEKFFKHHKQNQSLMIGNTIIPNKKEMERYQNKIDSEWSSDAVPYVQIVEITDYDSEED